MQELSYFFSIIFYSTMSAIAVLSFRQAKITVFSPIKTETFKIQVEEIREILKLFNKRNNTSFDDMFDYNKILTMNYYFKKNEYGHIFFGECFSPDLDVDEVMRSQFFGLSMKIDAMNGSDKFGEITSHNQTYFIVDEIRTDKNIVFKLKERSRLSQEDKLLFWKSRKVDATNFTKKYHQSYEKIRSIAASPLLPKELTDLIYEFLQKAHENMMFVVDIINDDLANFPTKFPNERSLLEKNKLLEVGLNNTYSDMKHDLTSTTGKILKYISEYLEVNNLSKN